MRPTPLSITLEFVRASEGGDRFAFRFAPQEYLLRKAGGTYASARCPWDADLLKDLEALQRPRPDPAAAQRIGDRLRTFLGPVGVGASEEVIAEAIAAKRPVFLSFRSAAAELYALPWELVTLASGQRLASIPEILLRYEWTDAPSRTPAPASEAGRILFAWSAAGGGVPAGGHLDAIDRSCREGNVVFDAHRDVLEGVSAPRLAEALAAPGPQVSILHLLCHGGAVVSGTAVYGLVWNGSQGDRSEPEVVDPDTVARILSPHAGSLRLVVISACLGGNQGDIGNHLGSVAQALHRSGIQAVVASRTPISAEGSVLMSETFYRALLEDPASVEESLKRARARLAESQSGLDWAALQLFAREVDGNDTRPIAFRPYRGLFAFGSAQGRFYFGRDAEAAALESRISNAAAGLLPHFQVLAGDSGVGKSSLVRAGLFPRLELGKRNWDCVYVTPGSEPFTSLWAELQRLEPRLGNAPPALDASRLLAALGELREARPGRVLLIVIDRLDDALGPAAATSAGNELLRALWQAGAARKLQVVVLAVVETLARAERIEVDPGGPLLGTILGSEEHTFTLGPASKELLSRAIVAPAEKVGLILEDGLESRLLEDVRGERGALPLLQHTLDLLWGRRSGRTLTAAAYDAMGGVAGSIAAAADLTFAELPETVRVQARRLMLELTELDAEGTPVGCRRVRLDDIRPSAPAAAAEFDLAVTRLQAARLVVCRDLTDGKGGASSTWAEIAHEALLRRWPALREWLKSEAPRLGAARDVRALADGWQRHRGDPDGGASCLLRGPRLDRTLADWSADREALGASGRSFLDASVEEAERSRRLEKSRTRRRVGILGATAAAALALAFAVWFLRVHLRSGRIVDAAWSSSSLTDRPAALSPGVQAAGSTLAALLLPEAGKWADEDRLREIAERVLQAPVTYAVLDPGAGPLVTASWSPDDRTVLTATERGRVQLWTGEGRPLRELLGREDATSRASPVVSAQWSPDGARVLVAWAKGTVEVHALGGGPPAVLVPPGRRLKTAQWSPKGERVLLAGVDGTVRLVRSSGGSETEIYRTPQALLAAQWSPGGDWVLVTSTDGRAYRVPADGQGRPSVIARHDDWIHTAAVSSNGQWIVTGSLDWVARLSRSDGSMPKDLPISASISTLAWSSDSRAFAIGYWAREDMLFRTDADLHVGSLSESTAPTTAMAFGPRGHLVATGTISGTLRLSTTAGHSFPPGIGHSDRIVEMRFDTAGERLLTASADGTARIWDLVPPGRSLLGPDDLERAALSPDGAWIAAAGEDGHVYLWCTCAEGTARIVPGHEWAVRSVRFTRDSSRVVTASDDGTAMVTPVAGEGPPVCLLGHHKALNDAVPSPDGEWIATASDDGTARIWNAHSGQVLRILHAHEAPVTSVAWEAAGQSLITTSRDGSALRWEVWSESEPLLLAQSDGAIDQLDISADGRTVALGDGDGEVLVWDEAGPKSSRRWSSGALNLVKWRPDGGALAVAGYDRRVWVAIGPRSGVPGEADRDIGRPTALPAKNHGMIRSIDWSPDGSLLALGSDDRTVSVCHVLVPECHEVWRADASIRSVQFDRHGERLLAASHDGRIRLLDVADSHRLSVAALMDELRQRTALCLPPEDRMRILGEWSSAARKRFLACEARHGRGRGVNPETAAAALSRGGP